MCYSFCVEARPDWAETTQLPELQVCAETRESTRILLWLISTDSRQFAVTRLSVSCSCRALLILRARETDLTHKRFESWVKAHGVERRADADPHQVGRAGVAGPFQCVQGRDRIA